MRLIAVDLGTASTRATLFDENLRPLDEAIEEVPQISESPGWHEMDADAVLRSVTQTISALVQRCKERIDCLCFSCAPHTLLAVDNFGRPLTRVFLWNDARSHPFAAETAQNGVGLQRYLRTGVPCHAMSPVYKLAWLKDAQPEIFTRAHKFISVKEYVLFYLLDRWVADHSIASGSGLLNLRDLAWDEDILCELGVREDQLPELADSTAYFPISLAASEALGLPEAMPIVLGGDGDSLSCLGSGALRPGTASITIGTSSKVGICVDKPVFHQQGKVACQYLVEGMYIVSGTTSNGGIAFRWLRDRLSVGTKLSYELLDEQMGSVPPGASGLLFLPYLFGERAPHWDSDLRAAFIGLSGTHGFGHMVRAVTEGVCMSVRDVLDTVADVAGEVTAVRADGGFAFSPVWVQSLADILGVQLELQQDARTIATGAALLALKAQGVIASLRDTAALLPADSHVRCIPANTLRYQALFDQYLLATDRLRPVLHALASMQA